MAGRTLTSWSDIDDDRWTSILVGNGLSTSICPAFFDYVSLFCKAKEEGFLTRDCLPLFDDEGLGATENFELVLLRLGMAERVAASLRVSMYARLVRAKHDQVREALIQTVHSAHPKNHIDAGYARLASVGLALRDYDYVFTTNYDLLMYWSLMELTGQFVNADKVRADHFRDGFSGLSDEIGLKFDWERAEAAFAAPGDYSRLVFLHGGLHLASDKVGGENWKLNYGYTQRESILDAWTNLGRRGAQPLFISEGRWQDKLMAVVPESYLDWTMNHVWPPVRGGLVIFGQSLTLEHDGHLMEHLRRTGRTRAVAVAIHEASEKSGAELRRIFLKYESALEGVGDPIWFFDAREHPLARERIPSSAVRHVAGIQGGEPNVPRTSARWGLGAAPSDGQTVEVCVRGEMA